MLQRPNLRGRLPPPPREIVLVPKLIPVFGKGQEGVNVESSQFLGQEGAGRHSAGDNA